MWPYAAPMPNTANAITVALQKSPRTQKQRTPTTPYGGVVQGYLKLKRLPVGHPILRATSSATNACLMKAHSEPIPTIMTRNQRRNYSTIPPPNNAMLRTAATIAVANST